MDRLYTLLIGFDWLIAVLIMISYVIIDGLYAKYTFELVSLDPLRSATIGSFMHFLLAFGVINYTENWLYIFPVVIGSWLGTFYVVRYEKQKADNTNRDKYRCNLTESSGRDM